MRILGFSQKWPKLKQDEFTTFRFPRKDKDWQRGEIVAVFYKPRSKKREMLGFAKVITKELRSFVPGSWYFITDDEAKADGFRDLADMSKFFYKQYKDRIYDEYINKLTLRWIR